MGRFSAINESGRGKPALLTGCMVALMVGCLALTSLGYLLLDAILGLDDDATGLGPVVQLALIAAWLIAGHVVTIMWAIRTHPGVTRATITQIPYVAAYISMLVWWNTPGWSPWFVAWGAAVGVVLAWLVVWYLVNPSSAQRAVVFLAILAVLILGNAAAIAALTWSATNGFGLKGQPNPWTAFNTLASASCLTDNSFHWNGDNLVEADCPSGPDADFYAGDYDESTFGDSLCDDQPRAAFSRWWEWNKQYKLSFRLAFTDTTTTVDGVRVGPPYPAGSGGPAVVDGSIATMAVTMHLESAIHIGEPDPWKMTGANTFSETWTVHSKSVPLGGWKICRIDIPNQIKPQFEPTGG